MDVPKNFTQTDFYSGYFQLRPSLVLFATYSAVITPAAIGLLYFIIWFEHYGPDSRRTFTNRMVSPICWASIIFFLVPQNIDFFRYFYGPYSHNLCYFNLYIKNVLTIVNIFFFASITISRYVSIFLLKNPLGYFDDFWYRFTCVWVNLSTFLIQYVLDFLPGKHPLNYFVCTGKDPDLDDSKETKIIRNHSMLIGCIMLIIIYLIISIRIMIYERKDAKTSARSWGRVVDKKPMTDYLVVISYIMFLVLHILLLLKVQSLDMKKMDVYPNYIYLYYLHLWLLPNFSLTLISIYFIRNHQLRDTFVRECKSFIADHLNIKN